MNYNSESDESLENMKLDLIKAKYAHQKIKHHDYNNQNQIKSKDLNNLKTERNNLVGLNKTVKNINNPKLSKSPSMSKKSMELNNNYSIIENNPNISYTNSENSSDDEEDADISKINEYVDYLLNKKRISMNDDVINDLNLISAPVLQETSTPTYIRSSKEAYHRSSSDYSPINVPSTDILAQWRLRRKINEAQNSVKTEHQRHNLHIHSLKSQIINDNESDLLYPVVIAQSYRNAEVSAKKDVSIECEYDQIPVRDVMNKDLSLKSSVKTNVKSSTPQTVNVSCQCQLDKQNKRSKRRIVDSNAKNKTVGLSKNQKSIAIMTCGNEIKTRKPIDCYTQTDLNNCKDSQTINVKTSTEWEDERSTFPDYIDMAIEKTLQSQLFEGNYSPAMSTITSINESQHIDSFVQMNSQSLCTEDNYKNAVNLDTVCEELPWNGNFEIDSDEEFQYDNVLVDLRQRRSSNLEKLRHLVLEIESHKSRYLATIESC